MIQSWAKLSPKGFLSWCIFVSAQSPQRNPSRRPIIGFSICTPFKKTGFGPHLVDVLIVIVISQKKKTCFLLNMHWLSEVSPILSCYLDALGKDHDNSIHLPPRAHACQGTTTSIKVSGSHINLTSQKNSDIPNLILVP